MHSELKDLSFTLEEAFAYEHLKREFNKDFDKSFCKLFPEAKEKNAFFQIGCLYVHRAGSCTRNLGEWTRASPNSRVEEEYYGCVSTQIEDVRAKDYHSTKGQNIISMYASHYDIKRQDAVKQIGSTLGICLKLETCLTAPLVEAGLVEPYAENWKDLNLPEDHAIFKAL